MNFKEIHIGTLINQRVTESGIALFRICNFLKCDEEEIQMMFDSESLDASMLLKWSKLLEYDFFRIYSQHLILYAPVAANIPSAERNNKSELPRFRKNIYTIEVIEFILSLLKSGEKTKSQIIEEYKIPKTTLYKWINKYKN